MKKLFILIVLIGLFLGIVGCASKDLEFVLTKAMVEKNIIEQEEDIKVQKNTISFSEINNNTVVDDSFFSVSGLIIFKDLMGNTGCFSLFTNNKLFPNIVNGNVEIMIVNFGSREAHYVKTTNNNNQNTVYDIFGNIVIETNEYKSINIIGTMKVVIDEHGGFDHYDYIESISTVKLQDHYLGNTIPVTKDNLINIENGNRSPYSRIEGGEFYVGYNNKIDLKDYGLADYYAKVIGTYLYVYNETDQLVNTVNFKDAYLGRGTNGKLIYQIEYFVDKDSKDYTYLNGQNKYLLNSYSMDLLTGEVKELNLEYQIQTLEPYMDENGEHLYGYANIKDIISKNLSEKERKVIVDSNGKILSEVGPFALTDLKKLSDNYFYDSFTRTVLDGELNPLYTFASFDSIQFVNNIIIVRRSGLEGAMDYSGKIVIPFEYYFISTYMYNGKRMGWHIDDNYYFINTDGTKIIIDESYSEITQGLLYKYKYDYVKGMYNAEFYDYKEKTNFDYISAWYPSGPVGFTNIYGKYYANRYTVSDVYKYVLIDGTAR